MNEDNSKLKEFNLICPICKKDDKMDSGSNWGCGEEYVRCERCNLMTDDHNCGLPYTSKERENYPAIQWLKLLKVVE